MRGTDSTTGGLTVLLSAFLVGVAIGILGTIQLQGRGPPVVTTQGAGDATAPVSPGENERGGGNADLARIEAALVELRRSTLEVCRIKADPIVDAKVAEDGPDRPDLPAASAAFPNLPEPLGVSRASDASAPGPRINQALRSKGPGPDGRSPNGREHRDGGPVSLRGRVAADVPRQRPGAASERRCPLGGRGADRRPFGGAGS